MRDPSGWLVNTDLKKGTRTHKKSRDMPMKSISKSRKTGISVLTVLHLDVQTSTWLGLASKS